MFTFGQTSMYQHDERFNLIVSDDKRALTLQFSDLHAGVGGSEGLAPVSTCVFSLVFPLEGEEKKKKAKIEFILQGFVLAPEGTTATVMCSVNGQTTVADFSGGSNQSFTHKLRFAAARPSEARLCVFLLVGRDSSNNDAQAQLSVSSLDAEILPRPKQPS